MASSFFSHVTNLHKRLIVLIIILLVAGGIGYGVFRFVELSQEVARLKSSPQAAAEAAKTEVKKLVEQVGKLIAVPTDETPTVATVSDSEKLKVNPFFQNAQNGDKVLIFTGAKKAIIYRPADNKIIEVGPLSIGTPSASAAQPMKFVLYNGTSITGFTKTYEATLKELVKSAIITDRDNAAKRDYSKSLIVDLTGANSVSVAELAKTLGMEVRTLPAGEAKPTGADFLIILGEDKK
ncbi:hypothetical protein HZB58_01760 [Candidatus Gottesmanbacteria bacterium]|nr:hypothetical protein [Candidatus Gottesmanbacteria bacterium]